ncbi:hypothetical protein AB0D14_28610 [Streptomyces sp. NPDC048484]|uniref:hypothetical protein n=1 Tax=Streptomyces sp. NPDC048484 TaxID=3155146 RepID=UPI003448AC2A
MTAADTLSVQVLPRRQDPVPPVPDRVDALLAETTVVGRAAQFGSRPAVPRYGWSRAQAHAHGSACMSVGPRATGRGPTQIVGRVEAEELVGASHDEPGAGLPYG